MISTVYYPNLFPSESWLRLAALCWDEVYTLHYENNPTLPDEIANLNAQLGSFIMPRNTFILGHNPVVSDKFTDWVSRVLKRDVLLPELWKAKIDVNWYEMFGNKFPKKILNELDSVLIPSDNPDKVFLPNEVSLYYMSLCASQLAEEEKADLFADSEVFARTALFNNQARGKITTSIMELYVPENLDSLELSQIRDLRGELSQQRLKFQGAVNSLCDEFAKTTSEEKLQSKQKEIVEIAQERIDLVKNTYKRANQNAVLTGLGMSLIPSSITAVASMLSVGVFLPAAIVSAIATTSASILIQRERALDEMKSSSWSYVLEIERRTNL